jgi:HEAT repeat protein
MKNKIIILFILFFCVLQAEKIDSRHVLFLMHQSQVEKAFSNYQKYVKEVKHHDFDLLQQMGQILLQNGSKSSNEKIKQLTMLGAGLINSKSALSILEKGLNSEDLNTQMIAMNFISTIKDDYSNKLLLRAMNSNFLPVRFEAAFELALRKHIQAPGQIESLMHKLPFFLKPYFPSLFASIGSPQADAILQELINDKNIHVRIEAILNAANHGKDEMLKSIQMQANGTNVAQLEACSYAFGVLKDSSSFKKLKKLSLKEQSNIKIAALYSLHLLGDETAKEKLEDMAMKKNLFAIATLSKIGQTKNTLYKLLNDKNIDIKINAALSLLALKDEKCIETLKEILIADQRDIALQPAFSIGRTLMHYKTFFSAKHLATKQKVNLELATNLKIHILKQSINLEKKDFLKIAAMVFENKQNDLVPVIIHLLKNITSDEVIEFLKKYSNLPGAPFVRDYCHLALYKLTEEAKYEKYVIDWILRNKDTEIIKLKNVLPKHQRFEKTLYSLTAEEKNKLLLDMYNVIAQRQNEAQVDILINAIKVTIPENRFALAGLIIKATE